MMRKVLLFSGILLFFMVRANAAVAVDTTMTGGNGTSGQSQQASSATSISSTGITVGASATCLVMMIGFQGIGSSNIPTGVAATWNGASMTARSNVSYTGGTKAVTAYIFTLVNPASGAKTLSTTWTVSQDAYMSAISFTGTDTTTCVNVGDNVTATQPSTTLTVASDANGASVAIFIGNGATPTMNFTTIWGNDNLNPGGGGTYNLGGTSNGHTFTGGGGDSKALAGVHVIAPTSSPRLVLVGAAAVTGQSKIQ